MEKISKTYKGKNIYKVIPSGYYEIYCDVQKRFIKFDTFEGVKNHIDSLESSEQPSRDSVIQKLQTYYLNCSCDKFGQIGVISQAAIVKTEQERVILRSIVNVSTYSGKFSVYAGFPAFGAFKDDKVENLCKEAFKQNENRREAMITRF